MHDSFDANSWKCQQPTKTELRLDWGIGCPESGQDGENNKRNNETEE